MQTGGVPVAHAKQSAMLSDPVPAVMEPLGHWSMMGLPCGPPEQYEADGQVWQGSWVLGEYDPGAHRGTQESEEAVTGSIVVRPAPQGALPGEDCSPPGQ